MRDRPYPEKQNWVKDERKTDGTGRQEQSIFVSILPLLKGRWGLLLELVVFGGILLAIPSVRQPLVELVGAISQGDGPAVRDLIQSYGPLAPVVSIALILLHTIVPFPAELVNIANGLAFGFWGGLAVSWTGFMLSALLLYAAGCLWGSPLLERAISERHQRRLDDWLDREGAFPLLAARLIPLIPFNAVGLAAGAVRAPLWTYTWTTGVGILPLGATVTFLGSRLGEDRPHLGATFWALSGSLLIAVLAAWWIKRRRPRNEGC
jgi:uncharacterized membrane protein YdjX (TVP38/TMEM64 family)